MGLLNLGLFVSIAFIALAFLWIVYANVGVYIAPEYWLLIFGVVGLFSMVTYRKNRER